MTIWPRCYWYSFCSLFTSRICQIAKKRASAQLPNVAESSIVNPCLSHNLRFLAIVLAVHDHKKKQLHAFLAPITAQGDLKIKWKVAGLRLGIRLKDEDTIFICVPLDRNSNHLLLDSYRLWYVILG